MSARFCLVALCLSLLVSRSAWAQSPDPAEPQQPAPSGDTAIAAPADEPVDGGAPQTDNPEEEVGLRQPEALYRGLFGPPPDAGRVRRAANVNVSAMGAYDHNDSTGASVDTDPRFTESGAYGEVATAVDYLDRRSRTSFSAYGGAAVTRYEVLESTQGSYNGGAGFTGRAGRNTFHASQTVDYSPYYQLGLFAAAPPSAPSDVTIPRADTNLDLASLQSLNYSTNIDFTRALSRRSSFGLLYAFHQSTFADESQYDLNEQRVGARYLQAMSPYATLHLEYAYRTGRYAESLNGETQHSHDINVGVDYGRTLSFSQRTKVTFSTGSSVLMNDSAVSEPSSDEGTHVFVTGNASLLHTLSRTWLARGSYQRSVRFVQGFAEPFISDSVTANISGYVNRRFSLTFESSYTGGTVGTTGVGNSFREYVTTSYGQVALSRHWALFGQALYYHYTFDQAVVLPQGLPPALNRSGIRIGLTTWVPLTAGKD